MKRARPLVLVGLVVLAALAARQLRDALGIELSPESLRASVAAFGWTAPPVFLLLVVVRPVLLLPSVVILTAGGLCFGAALGTVLGGVGVGVGAAIQFALARGIFGGALRRRSGERLGALQRRVGRAGPWLVGFVTAHPAGPMTPFHWAAGLASVPTAGFLAAVALGGTFRAGLYSAFGASLLDAGSPVFYAATGVLVLAIAGPLLHPGLRRQLFPPEARLGQRGSDALAR